MGCAMWKRCAGDSHEGLGIIVVELEEGGDYRAFREEIDSALAGIDDFPELVEEPVVTHLNTTDQVLTVLVAGAMRRADLKLYAEGLKDRLQELPEVSLVKVEGFSDHQLRVELSAEAMVRFNLSPADVAATIARQSVDMPLGTIETRDEEVLVRFTEERATAEELGDLVVLAGKDGAEVRLRELGRMVDDFEFEEQKVTLNGRAAASLKVEKTRTEDSIRVATAVKQFLEKERAERRPWTCW